MKKKSVSGNIHEILTDIYKITLPLVDENPGPVNVYLFVGGNTTLIDTGILQTANEIESCIAEIGLSFRDIDQLLITHGHIDHYGAANLIVKKSGGSIRVGAHKGDLRSIKTGKYASIDTIDNFNRLMEIPDKYLEEMKVIRTLVMQMAENCHVDFTLKDGDDIQLGQYKGRVVSTPGHSTGSVCFYLEKENVIFSGDHILKHITPNALVMLDDNHELPVRLSQKEYFDSIAKVEKLSPTTVYPAHGEIMLDLYAIIKGYRNGFLERQNSIISILKSGPHSVYKLARKLFPDLNEKLLSFEINLAVSEVFTHLQVLEQKGIVELKIEKTLQVSLL
jgi:glyoxylase-like metal-dependent hydrolase (beta-lactamase superfamily II)